MSSSVVVARPVLADVVSSRLPAALAASLPVLAGTALTAACAQLAFYLPGNPVPITVSLALYLLLSLVGLPVLAPNSGGNHTTGSAVLHLPTLGYLIGFVVAGSVLGLAARRGLDRKPWWTAASFLGGSAVIYLFGATWLALDLHLSARTALHLGVTPFLIGDLVKATVAAAVLPGAWWITRQFDK